MGPLENLVDFLPRRNGFVGGNALQQQSYFQDLAPADMDRTAT